MIKVIDIMSGQIKEIPNKKERARMSLKELEKERKERERLVTAMEAKKKFYEKATTIIAIVFDVLAIILVTVSLLTSFKLSIIASFILIILVLSSTISFLLVNTKHK